MLKVPILGYIPGLATVVMVTVFLPDPTVVEHGLTQHMEIQWNGFLWGLLGSCVWPAPVSTPQMKSSIW